MVIKTPAIVIRKFPLRETSLIVTFYTHMFGKVKAVCKGIRQLKSRTLSHYELPNLLEIQLYYKPNRELQLVSDSQLLHFFSPRKQDVNLYLNACYALEVVDYFTQVALPSEALFRLIHTFLRQLESRNFQVVTTAFVVKALRVFGIFPNFQECVGCGDKIGGVKPFLWSFDQGGLLCDAEMCQRLGREKTVMEFRDIQLCHRLLHQTFGEIHSSDYAGNFVDKIEDNMKRYISYLTDERLKSLKVIREMVKTEGKGI